MEGAEHDKWHPAKNDSGTIYRVGYVVSRSYLLKEAQWVWIWILMEIKGFKGTEKTLFYINELFIHSYLLIFKVISYIEFHRIKYLEQVKNIEVKKLEIWW